MMKRLRNRGWLTVLTFATLFAPQVVIAQEKAPKDTRPMLFGFMVDGQMVQAKVVGGEVTATVAPRLTRNNLRRGFYVSNTRGQTFPKKQMKVSKGLVRFMDKHGNVAAELTHWNGGGNLTVAPRRVPVRLGITLAKSKVVGLPGKVLGRNGQQGIKVDEIAPEGPADKAGMKAGDLILEINGKPATEKVLQKALKERKPGDSLKLKVDRDDKEVELTAKLEAAPEKADPFGVVSGRLDPLVGWRRGQIVRAKKDIEALARQQAVLQALLKRQAATIQKEVKKGALAPESDQKKAKDKEQARDVFLRIESELKKSSDQADKRKKELDAKLDELKVEEARQNALIWMNRANRRGLTFLPNNNAPKKAAKVAKKRDPVWGTAQRLVLVDPNLTGKPGEDKLGRQVKDLEKRMARIESLLEESLVRQREAEKKASRHRNLENRKKEIEAKIREVKRLEEEAPEKGKDKR